MSKYRNSLPQNGRGPFLTDGGLETTLLFQQGFDLPEFAAFILLKTAEGKKALEEYYIPYIELADRFGFGFILESPTWRAGSSWGEKLGYDASALRKSNVEAIELLAALRRRYEKKTMPMVISGCIGPRGDGYIANDKMSPEQARDYHTPQLATLSATEVDMVSAFTMNYVEEAIGITLAAQSLSLPVVISFTLETDGRLASGSLLGSAIEQVDQATDGYPSYFMINCAHPTHFQHAFKNNRNWVDRIRGIRANASTKSHAELDESEHLDAGDPTDLGESYVDLKSLLPRLNVFGGCCGTDHGHIEMICNRVKHVV